MQLKALGLSLAIAISVGYLAWVFLWVMFENTVPFLSWYSLIPVSAGVAIAVVAWAIKVLDSDN